MNDFSVRITGNCRLFSTAIDTNTDQRRKAEIQAVRRLADEAFGKDAIICHDSNGAPFIDNKDCHISISHSRDTACLALSFDRPVGVDIEQPREQLSRVAHRVLSDAEMSVYGSSLRLLLRAWTLKEALYKAALTPGLDFRTDICLPLDLNCMTASVKGRIFDILLIYENDRRTIALTQPREP